MVLGLDRLKMTWLVSLSNHWNGIAAVILVLIYVLTLLYIVSLDTDEDDDYHAE